MGNLIAVFSNVILLVRLFLSMPTGFAESIAASDAVQMDTTEAPSSSQPVQSPLLNELTTKKQKHDSGFISDPDTSIGPPLEAALLEDDGRKKKKKKKKEKKKSVEATQEDDDLEVEVAEGSGERTSGDISLTESVFMEEEIEEERIKTVIAGEAGTDGDDLSHVHKKKKKKKKDHEVTNIEMKEDVVSPEEKVKMEESKKEKKKKKKKKRTEDGDDSFEFEKLNESKADVMKEESVSLEEQARELEIGSEKKKKKKKKHSLDHYLIVKETEDVVVDKVVNKEHDSNTLVAANLEMESGKKKKKKKKKSLDRNLEGTEMKGNGSLLENHIGDGDVVVNEELSIEQSIANVNLEDGMLDEVKEQDGQKVKKKKHKRKLSDHKEAMDEKHNVVGINGTGDPAERTTQIDVSGTVDDSEYVPPKKKKKKQKKEKMD